MSRSAKPPSRAALLQQLGEETLALFRGGALPVPTKLRQTVALLDAVKAERPAPRRRTKK